MLYEYIAFTIINSIQNLQQKLRSVTMSTTDISSSSPILSGHPATGERPRFNLFILMADEVVKSTFAQLQSDLMKRSELVSQIGERSGFANHKSERSRFAKLKALESRVVRLKHRPYLNAQDLRRYM